MAEVNPAVKFAALYPKFIELLHSVQDLISKPGLNDFEAVKNYVDMFVAKGRKTAFRDYVIADTDEEMGKVNADLEYTSQMLTILRDFMEFCVERNIGEQ